MHFHRLREKAVQNSRVSAFLWSLRGLKRAKRLTQSWAFPRSKDVKLRAQSTITLRSGTARKCVHRGEAGNSLGDHYLRGRERRKNSAKDPFSVFDERLNGTGNNAGISQDITGNQHLVQWNRQRSFGTVQVATQSSSCFGTPGKSSVKGIPEKRVGAK